MTAMITLKEKIGYGLGDMASSMFWKLFGSYLMIFYTDVFGLPAAVVGTMFLITRVWDSAFDPIVGVIADRTEYPVHLPYDFCLYRQFYCFAALHADGQPVWWCRRRATGMDVECGGDCCDVCGSVLSLFRLDT